MKITAFWDHHLPPVILDLVQHKKDNPLAAFRKTKYLEIRSRFEALFTDGSKDEERAGTLVYKNTDKHICQIPDGATVFSTMLNSSSFLTWGQHYRHCKVLTSEIHY